jgi:hypothetical protein
MRLIVETQRYALYREAEAFLARRDTPPLP